MAETVLMSEMNMIQKQLQVKFKMFLHAQMACVVSKVCVCVCVHVCVRERERKRQTETDMDEEKDRDRLIKHLI